MLNYFNGILRTSEILGALLAIVKMLFVFYKHIRTSFFLFFDEYVPVRRCETLGAFPSDVGGYVRQGKSGEKSTQYGTYLFKNKKQQLIAVDLLFRFSLSLTQITYSVDYLWPHNLTEHNDYSS